MIAQKSDGRRSAVLVSVVPSRDSRIGAAEAREELERLADTLGIESVREFSVQIREPNPKFLIGSGKLQEIADEARELGADCILFDDDLTPSQQRNWETETGIATLDRHELILDIFGKHATTREARLQVELAQTEYALPRLTNAWPHLSKQKGGTKGTRGEGETQLENDRRMVQDRIHRLKKLLEGVEKRRATQRKRRDDNGIPSGAVVGYTNAGKSSVLQSLTGVDLLVRDKLFATLDATSRKLPLPSSMSVVLTDTVGFIRKLPHDLVDAFHSTLEETVRADFLIHVVDASSPSAKEYHHETMRVLGEIGAANKPMITVLNKVDRVTDESQLSLLEHAVMRDGPCIRYSAHRGDGRDELLEAIEQLVGEAYPTREYAVPYARHDIVAMIHRSGRVLETHYEAEHVRLVAQVPEALTRKLDGFVNGNGSRDDARAVFSMQNHG